jgi:hypothetical protein
LEFEVRLILISLYQFYLILLVKYLTIEFVKTKNSQNLRTLKMLKNKPRGKNYNLPLQSPSMKKPNLSDLGGGMRLISPRLSAKASYLTSQNSSPQGFGKGKELVEKVVICKSKRPKEKSRKRGFVKKGERRTKEREKKHNEERSVSEECSRSECSESSSSSEGEDMKQEEGSMHHSNSNISEAECSLDIEETDQYNPINKWTNRDVITYIEQIGLSELSVILHQHDIRGKDLLSLTDAEIKHDLQITNLHHRKKLLRNIQKLNDIDYYSGKLSNYIFFNFALDYIVKVMYFCKEARFRIADPQQYSLADLLEDCVYSYNIIDVKIRKLFQYHRIKTCFSKTMVRIF